MSYFTRNMDKCSRLHSFPVTRYTYCTLYLFPRKVVVSSLGYCMWPRKFFFAIFGTETREMVLKDFWNFCSPILNYKKRERRLSSLSFPILYSSFQLSTSILLLLFLHSPPGLVKTASLCWTLGGGGIRWCSVKNILGGESGVRFNKKSAKY